MNKQGGRTVGLLTKLRLAQARIEGREVPKENIPLVWGVVVAVTDVDEHDADAVYTASLGLFGQLVEDGEMYEQLWINAVHGGYLPPRGETKQIKKAWEAWGKLGMTACKAAGIPIERGFGAVVKGRV